MKIEGYEVEELLPGIKVYRRKNSPHTTYEETCPWIHFHYTKNDSEGARDGSTEVELCCHGCGVALWVTMPFPASEEISAKAKALRVEFKKNHGTHNTIYMEGDGTFVTELTKQLANHPLQVLCPDARQQIFAVTLS
jgi:hypothetical protein